MSRRERRAQEANGRRYLALLDAERQCGTCNACCVVPPITTPGFEKGADEPCAHLAERGCGIYSDRPDVCRAYQCAWRVGLLHLADRPDRLGILIDLGLDKQPGDCLVATELVPGALEAKRARLQAYADVYDVPIQPVGLVAEGKRVPGAPARGGVRRHPGDATPFPVQGGPCHAPRHVGKKAGSESGETSAGDE